MPGRRIMLSPRWRSPCTRPRSSSPRAPRARGRSGTGPRSTPPAAGRTNSGRRARSAGHGLSSPVSRRRPSPARCRWRRRACPILARDAPTDEAGERHDGGIDPGLRPAIVVRRPGGNPAILALRHPFTAPAPIRSRESIWTRDPAMSNSSGRGFPSWIHVLA